MLPLKDREGADFAGLAAVAGTDFDAAAGALAVVGVAGAGLASLAMLAGAERVTEPAALP